MKNALEALSTASETFDVSRSEFLNGGSQWTVTFPAAGGDVASLYLDTSALTGTRVLAAVSDDIAGSSLGGSFYLYSNGGSSEGNNAFLQADEKKNNGTGRSQPLAWNAEPNDVRTAIEGLLPYIASEGTKQAYSLRMGGKR